MQPRLELLTEEQVDRILDEAFQLLQEHGIKVQSAEARRLLAEAGAQVDEAKQVAYIPESVVRRALAKLLKIELAIPHHGRQAGSPRKAKSKRPSKAS